MLRELPAAEGVAKVKLLKDIAFLYHLNDVLDSSNYYYSLLVRESEKVEDPVSLGDGYVGLGLVCYHKSQYEKSLEYYFKALKLYEDNKAYRNAAGALSNIANIYTEQDKYQDALKNLFHAVRLAKELKDTIILMALYTNVSRNYISTQEYLKARQYQDSGLELVRIKKELGGVSPMDSAKMFTIRLVLLQGRAHTLMDEKNYNEAIKILKELWNDVKLKRGVRDQTEILEQTASNYFYLKKYDSALYYSDRVLELLKKDSIPEQYRDIYEVMSESYAGKGDFEKAYTIHKDYKLMADSIINSEKLLMSEEMKAKYESEKKETQILELEKEKKAQQYIVFLSLGITIALMLFLGLLFRAKKLKEKLLIENQKLEASVASRNATELELLALRSQINPHFIFNSLNSISNYILKSDVDKANNYISKFAQLMRTSLEQSRTKNVSLEQEINLVRNYLELEKLRLGDKMDFDLIISPSLYEEDIQIPSMIIQPFVENAIKHGLPREKDKKGMVILNFSKNDSLLICSISDNGEGISSTQQNKSGKNQSLGNSITQKRIDLINSSATEPIEVEIIDQKKSGSGNPGTLVNIRFPISSD